MKRTTRALFLPLAALVLAVSLPARSEAQIVQNGGFEDATLAPWTGGGDFSGTQGSVAPKEGAKYAVLSFQSAFFNASSLTFSQEITIPTAGPVILDFFAQRFDPISGQDDVAVTFEARIDTTILANTPPAFAGGGVQASSWQRYRVATPGSLPAGTHTITFTFTRGSSGFGRSPQLALDGVSATQVSPTLVYEGFDIPPGQPLAGTSGATSTGWEGVWGRPFDPGGVVRAESLVRPPGTEAFLPQPVGGSAFCTGLQGNTRTTPANISATPSVWGSFLADPEVRFASGFSINFSLDVPCCGGGSLVSFGNTQDLTEWRVSTGFATFPTGNSLTDGVEAVVFQLEFNVSGTTDRLRVWFDADPNTQPPSFTVDADFGTHAPRFTVSFNSSNNFGGSDLAIDEIRFGAFEDVVIVSPALALTNAVSRKVHGSAGAFDIPLPLSGLAGVECRSNGGDHTLVFTFTNDVVSGSASIATGSGSISGAPTFSGNTMTVNLTGVTDAQQLNVNLNGITDAQSQVLPDTNVAMRVLLGDTTNNGVVNASDIAQTKALAGQPVISANFRNDINASGQIDSTDVGVVKSRTGFGIAP